MRTEICSHTKAGYLSDEKCETDSLMNSGRLFMHHTAASSGTKGLTSREAQMHRIMHLQSYCGFAPAVLTN